MSHPVMTHRRAIVVALFVTVLWSSSWILIRAGLDDEELAPVSFAGLRYGLAAAVLLTWILPRPRRRAELASLGPRDLRRLAGLGLVFVALTQGAQFVAIDNQPAATTSLVLAPTPLLGALASGRLIGEPPTVRQVLGAATIAVGSLLYFAGDLGATAIGMLAATVGLLSNVGGALLGRSINRDLVASPVVVTAISMTIGSSVLLATGFATEGWPRLTLPVIAIVAWLAVVNTAVAFTLWNLSLRHLAAVESAAINNTMLIQIAVLAVVFLDEWPGPLGIAGIVIVTLGAGLANARPRPHRPDGG